LGVVSSALPSLSQSFDLANSQQESFVGVLYLGSAAGSVFGGFLCDYLGRKSGILLTDVIFMVGSVLLAFAHSVPTLLIGETRTRTLLTISVLLLLALIVCFIIKFAATL
jgi:SP family myo-inositol transporter-like MFS transporter 13